MVGARRTCARIHDKGIATKESIGREAQAGVRAPTRHIILHHFAAHTWRGEPRGDELKEHERGPHRSNSETLCACVARALWSWAARFGGSPAMVACACADKAAAPGRKGSQVLVLLTCRYYKL